MSEVSSGSLTQLKVLNHDPLVAGVPIAALGGQVTPSQQFFIRNHFPIPRLDTTSWTLQVEGEVERVLHLTYGDLKGMASQEQAVTLECAGNSRATVQPPIEGLLWDHGGVSTGRWTGVSLGAVLGRAGLRYTAKVVLFEGADQGTENGATGQFNYAMSLPLDKALDSDTLLAYEMNGETISPEHGYPLRLVVPGWYGMTSVKWLLNIRVLDRAFEGFHQDDYYVFVNEGDEDGSPKQRVTSMRVKSLITWPGRGKILDVGSHVLRGLAWSGEGPVSLVEVSVDDGRTWQPAEVEGSESVYAWQQWRFQWEAIRPGYFLLRARATDSKGNVQPMQAKWNFRGFANNSIHAVPVAVRSGP